jgi:hypothetical protein
MKWFARSTRKGRRPNEKVQQPLQNRNIFFRYNLCANDLLIGRFLAIGPHGAAYRRGKKGEKPALVYGVEYPGRQYADEKV